MNAVQAAGSSSSDDCLARQAQRGWACLFLFGAIAAAVIAGNWTREPAALRQARASVMEHQRLLDDLTRQASELESLVEQHRVMLERLR